MSRVLGAEKEKGRLDKFTVKCKLNKQGWQFPCEIVIYISNFDYGSILFNREFSEITTFVHRRLIDEMGYCQLDQNEPTTN